MTSHGKRECSPAFGAWTSYDFGWDQFFCMDADFRGDRGEKVVVNAHCMLSTHIFVTWCVTVYLCLACQLTVYLSSMIQKNVTNQVPHASMRAVRD